MVEVVVEKEEGDGYGGFDVEFMRNARACDGKLHCTRHTPHATRHMSHVTRHTPHATRHSSHVTRHTSQIASSSPSILPSEAMAFGLRVTVRSAPLMF